ncbi:thioredoxin family protein [Polaribacter glomeratus]|uniref:Thioredoxin family protein n=1 Tax=Polaribacter glomeratus TaxID=102 RepID=A0A2S7WXC8_9FLAO|nr:thioredoxin family protein [Polaribacter glomeratus]PQJ82051.1 thioredoxin family protein [Polaribacter glomeratus]TXD66644.1 thioredoxin family protein [Polaribacter glomeratus]
MKTLKTATILAILSFFTLAFTVKTDGYKVGDKIENFKLKNIDDKMVSLSDYKAAKGFIIIFTCNMCPYSVANEDRIIALDAKYKTKGYPVIAINPNDPNVSTGDGFEDMKVRAAEKRFTFPYLFDAKQDVFPKFGALKTPHVYIVTKNTMKVEYIGAIDNSSKNADAVTEKYVEDAVDALLVGKKPEKTETRAIGCSIKVDEKTYK